MALTSSRRRGLFTSVLFSTMGVATFGALSLGILASVFRQDLGISRSQLGIAFAVNAVGAAVLSPFVGRVTDRIGGRRALLTVIALAALGFLLHGAAWSFAVLLVASAVAAAAQAGTNPATNKLIAEAIPAGTRGVITGVKQSGVPAFVFVGGLIVPSIAIAWGRFAAYAVVAAAAVLIGMVALMVIPPSRVPATGRSDEAQVGHIPTDIYWIAGYGMLLGFAGSVTILYALFTEERLGQSLVVGGAVAAVVGLTAVPSRILWARFAERRGDFRDPLMVIALISVTACGVLAVADAGAWWFVWLAAVLTGVGSSSWNSVGMLGLITIAGPRAAGRASGIVLFGFLVGLGSGPPLFGWIVDSSGSYDAVWLIAGVASAVGAGVMKLWSPTRKIDTGAEPA